MVIGPISDVLGSLREPRGEFTVVLTRAETAGSQTEVPPETEIFKEFCHLTESGLSRRASIRALAARYDVSSRRVYRALEDAREGD